MTSIPDRTSIPDVCQVWITSLNPARVELQFRFPTLAEASQLPIRGLLRGPRCLYSNTVQIAYPLRVDPANGTDRPTIIIPEPALWDPVSPFLYEGPVEMNQEGEWKVSFFPRIGFRWLEWREKRLRVNGHEIRLKAKRVVMVSGREELLDWHKSAINLLIIPAKAEFETLCLLADEIGFFVLAELSPDQQPLQWQHHPSLLGWVREGKENDLLMVETDFADAPGVQALPCFLERNHYFGLPALLQR